MNLPCGGTIALLGPAMPTYRRASRKSDSLTNGSVLLPAKLREDRAVASSPGTVKRKFLVRAGYQCLATSTVQLVLPEVLERLRSRTAKAEDDIRHACAGDSSSCDPLPALPRLCASRDWHLVVGSSSPNIDAQDPRESRRMHFFHLSRTWRNRLCH